MTLLPLVLALSAHAEPLAWAWQVGHPVRYHAELSRERDDGDWHLAMRNIEARARATNLALDTSCQAVQVLRKGWAMECVLDEVRISGTAMVEGEQERLSAIFDEHEDHLRGATAVFEMGITGRIKSFDIRAFEARTERESQVHDSLRMLLVPAFAQLELELPKGGDDNGKAWKQGGSPMVTQLRSSYGTAGAVVIHHTVEGHEDGLVLIGTEGRGTVAYGLAVESDGTKTIAVDLAGSAAFDQAAGVLARRESMVVGRFTAGAAYSSPTDHYREVASLERIPAGPVPAPEEPPAAPAAEVSEAVPPAEPPAAQEAPAQDPTPAEAPEAVPPAEPADR